MSGTAHIVELTAGVVNELASQGGHKFIAHPHGLMQTGAGLIQAAAVVAPSAVAAASAGTAVALSTVTAAAVALTPLAAIATVGYGCYKLFMFLDV